MSELRKTNVRDENFGPVQVAYYERWEDGKNTGIEKLEVSFTETSPIMRNRVLWYTLLTLLFFTMAISILVVVIGWVWIVNWENLTPADHALGFFALACTAVFCFLAFYYLRPPFRSFVLVTIEPESDRVVITRNAKTAADIALTDTREVAIGPHSELEAAQVRFDDNPSRAYKRHVNTYRQTESVFIVMGQKMAMNVIEVASVMGKQASRHVMAMRIRSAVDGCVQMGKELQRQARGRAPRKQSIDDGDTVQQPVLRRVRKGKIK